MISRDAFDGVRKIKLKVATGKKDTKNSATEKSTFIYNEKKAFFTSTKIKTKKDGVTAAYLPDSKEHQSWAPVI